MRTGFGLAAKLPASAPRPWRYLPGPGNAGRSSSFCIGEAAGWISPSSAERFSYAFISAENLGEAILGVDSGPEILRRYSRAARFLAANIAWKKCKPVVMYTPLLRSLVMGSVAFGV